MGKISWVDRVLNDEVLQSFFLDTVQQCKLTWTRHILRHDSLLGDIMEGMMMEQAIR